MIEDDSDTESDEELELKPVKRKLKFSELFGESYLYKIEIDDKIIKFGKKNKMSYYDLLKSFSKRRSMVKCQKIFKPTNTKNIYDWKYWEQARYDFNFDNFQDSIEHLISITKY